MIHMEQVTKHYELAGQQIPILKGIDLHISKGEFVAIMGPSGSGKSTLMNILGLLDRTNTGTYKFDGQDVTALCQESLASLRNKAVGFIFQSFMLLPKIDAIANICLPLMYQRLPNDMMITKSKDVLAKVGLRGYDHRKPTELSGGQQQRVAIARALVTQPKVILADEPTGALDTTTGQEIFDLLLQLNREEQTTIVVVTHDNHIAKQCQRIIQIRNGLIET